MTCHPWNYHKSGYGYQVRFVEDLENIDQDMAASLEWALSEIKKIQGAARSGKPIDKPRWPVLIMRTPKVRAARSDPIAAVEGVLLTFYVLLARAGPDRSLCAYRIMCSSTT